MRAAALPDGRIASNSVRDQRCRRLQAPKNRVRVKTNFVKPFKLIGSSSPHAKIFCFCFSEICGLFAPSRLDHRGAYRDRHERGARDAVDAAASGATISQGGLHAHERSSERARRTALKRTAKS